MRTRTTRYWVDEGLCLRRGVVDGSSPGTGYGPTPKINNATCVDEVHAGPPYRSGGPFSMQRTFYNYSLSQDIDRFYKINGFTVHDYKGRAFVDIHTDFTPLVPPIPLDLSGYGVKGWNQSLPVKPNLNLGVSLIELKDVPDMLKSTKEFLSLFKGNYWKGRSPKFWGEQFLNWEFGWKPVYDDLKGILNLGDSLDQKRSFLIQNNHSKIHKRKTLVNSSFETVLTDSKGFGLQSFVGGDAFDASNTGYFRATRFDATTIWFEGQFRFHIPQDQLFGDGWDRSLKPKLLGLYPDLNILYKVIPWTWLVDWFSAAGPSVSNATLMSEFAQVADYAYIMSHQKRIYKTVGTGAVYFGDRTNVPVSSLPYSYLTASAELHLETKQRVPASPYGFGLDWTGFNSIQLGILAALGLSRSKF